MIDLGQSPDVPFILYDFQRDWLKWVDWLRESRKNGLVEKARDMGASYLAIIYDVHAWLFEPGYKAGWGSYKQEKVDRRGDMDSMFEKARHLISKLPSWMIPDGFSVGGPYDNFMRLTNPATGATITGEVGDNVGRGGRNTRYTLDEFAFFQRPELTEKGVSQNAPCIVYQSTVNGMGNLFYKKRMSMDDKQIFVMDWRLHPLKDDAWYAEQKKKLDSITLAQEVDRDYSASVEGLLIPAVWVQSAVELEIEESGPVVAGLDVGETSDPSCYISRRGVVVNRIEQWSGINTTQTSFKARDLAIRDGIEKLKYDDIGIGAGVTGTLSTERDDADQGDEDREQVSRHLSGLSFELIGVPWGSADVKGEPFWDNADKKLKDRFLNQRIADWWHLRIRFEATYEHVNGIKEHPLDRLISIPRDHELIMQLSIPLMQYSSNGKMKLESKKDMKKRGVSSPNKADALAYCFSTYEMPTLIGAW